MQNYEYNRVYLKLLTHVAPPPQKKKKKKKTMKDEQKQGNTGSKILFLSLSILEHKIIYDLSGNSSRSITLTENNETIS